ncbi:uncharacterized protein LOC108221541 [Daucus carota subsp. sativus]
MSEIDSQQRINTTPLSAYNGHNKICRSGERVNFEEMDIGSSTPKSTLSSLHETSDVVQGQPAKIFLQPHDRPLRTPLSDITNNLSRNLSNTSANRGKVKIKPSNFQPQSLEPFTRNLFDEEFSRTPTTDKVIYDEDLEETRLPSSYLSDESLSDVDTSYEDQYTEEGFEDHSRGVFDTEDTHPNLTKNKKRCTRGSKYLIPEEYATLGAPSKVCSHCNSLMWHEERVNKNVTKGKPLFSICCRKGDVKLPEPMETPGYLRSLYEDEVGGSDFQRSIRLYNAMFAFTSAGGNVDHSINRGRGPYIYRLNGQNHHVFGSLIPDDGDTPKFCQLYIYDTANEVSNRLRWVKVSDEQPVDAEIVDGLIQMLDETNELVKKFRTARDRWENKDICDLKVELKVCRAQNGRENHISASNEVAGIMVGSTSNTTPDRDIIIEPKFGKLKRVSYVHPKFMALQYPLLFPNGEDGYHDKIPFQSADLSNLKERDFISMKDYYAYQFQVRQNHSLTTRLGGRLFQQYVVDAFSSIEQTRLWWFRKNQTILRNELYSHICDSVRNGDLSSSNVGKGVILPAGFVGSKRYMQQNFQDALAVCRHVGHPDIFLTMTTNPLWDEIQQMMKFLPGCKSENSPDIISRVFRLKLDQLTNDIKKKSFFGICVGEFQKRGLPHVHMLIWLDSKSKVYLKNNVDKFVSAEIPDPIKDPVGYAAVKAFMIHGPCGLQNTKSPCMKGLKCIRHFPKKYSARTMFDESGFPIYRRRRQNVTVHVRNADLDNQWVVPYNRDLLVKYQCHMNIEICCHARSLKYLFKYCLKGHDTATVHISGKKKKTSNHNGAEAIDEIDAYFDGRYICGAESAYRIFGFPIHHRTISVERLPFHLPGQKNCTFHSSQPLNKVAEREKDRFSKLEAFFHLCSTDVSARQYTYQEIPQHFVWDDGLRNWKPRKRGFQIGRLSYTHHSSGEVWFMRLLLTKVRGPTSFQSLRIVNGVCYDSFRDACKELGLLDDDKEWHEVLTQCSAGGLPPQIRQLFVHIIVNCKVTDLFHLWTSHWKHMVDDILLKRRRINKDDSLILDDKQLQFYALAEIDDLLRSIGKSLKSFPQLPQPPETYLNHGSNNLILEETNYNILEMDVENKKLVSMMNAEQLNVYNAILESVRNNEGGLHFVHGSGGCGKTFLWRTLISKLRSQGDIVLPVASSGIAATLMPGGRTAHSRFKIPIVLDELSVCAIGNKSDIAELIRHTKLIIWDEAPMQHRYAFECLDRSLRDIMKSSDLGRAALPFGGITVVLGGDFRQILPVIPHGDRAQILGACITRSYLWNICKIFVLTKNMRLNKGSSDAEANEVKEFAKWVLDVGNGTFTTSHNADDRLNEDNIEVPLKFCDLENDNSVENMIRSIYPDFVHNSMNPEYLSERAILTPTNQTVGHLNSLIVDMIPGEAVTYYSVDSAEDFGGTDADLHCAFPIEYLNSLSVPGMPAHDLKLKVGVVVMLMRNLNQTLGLCNGTRMIVTKCLKFCVECEVICGSFKGTRHFIPRMELCPSDSLLPFKLVRKQMPLQICYAMTINKSQGQSLKTVGLFLPKPVFTHGQFYVAVSRVTSPGGLKIFIDDDRGFPTNITQNVVYKEVFYALPR